jgi:hypothetical protein
MMELLRVSCCCGGSVVTFCCTASDAGLSAAANVRDEEVTFESQAEACRAVVLLHVATENL